MASDPLDFIFDGSEKIEEMMCFSCFGLHKLAWYPDRQPRPYRITCIRCGQRAAYIVEGVH